MLSTRWIALSGALWSLFVVAGFTVLARHEFAAGRSGHVPDRWPDAARVERTPEVATLLVFAHPHCPCTRATIGELERIVAHAHDRLNTVVLFFDPGTEASWTKTDLWDEAASIPGVRVERDLRGETARAFGVATSGHALLYDASGKLVFQGGITGSRGHAGDNAGSDAIQAWVARERDSVARERAAGARANVDSSANAIATPVFGCGFGTCEASEARSDAP